MFRTFQKLDDVSATPLGYPYKFMYDELLR